MNANSPASVTENRLIVDHDFLLLPSKSILNSISTSKITEEKATVIRHHATSGAISFKLWSLKPTPNELMWESMYVSDYSPCTDGLHSS